MSVTAAAVAAAMAVALAETDAIDDVDDSTVISSSTFGGCVAYLAITHAFFSDLPVLYSRVCTRCSPVVFRGLLDAHANKAKHGRRVDKFELKATAELRQRERAASAAAAAEAGVEEAAEAGMPSVAVLSDGFTVPVEALGARLRIEEGACISHPRGERG
jgi:hypothetical protein